MSIKLPINFSLNSCKFPHSNKQKLIFLFEKHWSDKLCLSSSCRGKELEQTCGYDNKKTSPVCNSGDHRSHRVASNQETGPGQWSDSVPLLRAPCFIIQCTPEKWSRDTHTHTRPTATELLQKLLEGHVRPIQTNDTWHTKKFKLIHNDIEYKLINFIIKLDRFCAKEATSNQLSEVLLVTLTFRDKGGIKDPLMWF